MHVVDAHVHIQPWSMLRPGAREVLARGRDPVLMDQVMKRPEAFLELLDHEGIEWVVNINYVSPDIMGFTDAANDFALDYAARCAGRMVPIGSIHPRCTPRPARRLEELIRRGLRGLKIHPSHQSIFPNEYRHGKRVLERIYRRAEQEGLVVIFHTGTSIFPGARNVYADPIHVDDVAVDFPGLKIVLAHGGRPLWMETCMFLVRRHPNVWMDISSVPPKRLFHYFPRLTEVADKVLFGSDWPAPGVPGMAANAQAVAALDLPPEAREAIFHGNAERLYGR